MAYGWLRLMQDYMKHQFYFMGKECKIDLAALHGLGGKSTDPHMLCHQEISM